MNPHCSMDMSTEHRSTFAKLFKIGGTSLMDRKGSCKKRSKNDNCFSKNVNKWLSFLLFLLFNSLKNSIERKLFLKTISSLNTGNGIYKLLILWTKWMLIFSNQFYFLPNIKVYIFVIKALCFHGMHDLSCLKNIIRFTKAAMLLNQLILHDIY